MIRKARARGYHLILHYIVIGSAAQAVARVALRVKLGGHHVPADAIQRRFVRSRANLLSDYLPLADEWALWDNNCPPARRIADSTNHTAKELRAMLESSKIQEEASRDMPQMVRIVLEASRVATEKMLDYYKRMGIKVTPQMTLAPDHPEGIGRKGVNK